MNEEKLSQRLETVVSYIPKGARIADIGSDHAYLPCYAILNDIASYAIAGEVVKGPYQSAVQQVQRVGLENQIDVRLGSGLTVLREEDNIEAVTIAGMGGALIASILTEGQKHLYNTNRLILQPNVGGRAVRQWLVDEEWTIVDEVILKEDDKIYEVIVADRTSTFMELSKAEILMGPKLMQERNDAFIEKWSHELRQTRNVLQQLQNAQSSEETEKRKREIEEKIVLIEGVING